MSAPDGPCRVQGCERNRIRGIQYCAEHEDIEQARKRTEYDDDPQRQVEQQLAEADTVELLQAFIAEHLLPD